MREWAHDRLAAYKLPRDMLVVNEIEKNATGKVNKKLFFKLFLILSFYLFDILRDACFLPLPALLPACATPASPILLQNTFLVVLKIINK